MNSTPSPISPLNPLDDDVIGGADALPQSEPTPEWTLDTWLDQPITHAGELAGYVLAVLVLIVLGVFLQEAIRRALRRIRKP